ncbi:hypothetical protein KAR91_78665 [Candidatus Pacearchaeota archaeon]|nr:hypothetical protein [Candidatus Pacearchaeota archaeon]
MKQLTDSELKEFAVSLLDKQGLEQYEQFIAEHDEKLRQDPEANGFHNTPAGCEGLECNICEASNKWKLKVGCPYVD